MMNSEHEEQCMIFQWAKLNETRYPELKYMFSTLNGVRLTMGQAKKAKRGGNKKGVPDIILPFNNGSFCGLWIELKTTKGRPSKEQLEFIDFLNKQGFYAEVVHGSLKAIRLIERYLKNTL